MKRQDLTDTMWIEDYRMDVARFIKENNERTNQRILITLRLVEKEFGKLLANQIIVDFDLTRKFRIPLKPV